MPVGGFKVWVTHNFVSPDLAGAPTASAEGLVLGVDDSALFGCRQASRRPEAAPASLGARRNRGINADASPALRQATQTQPAPSFQAPAQSGP